MSKSAQESQIRDELLELAIKDMLGPAGGPEEEISLDAEFGRLMKPTDRYLLGMLAPRDTALPESELNSPTPWTPEEGSETTSAAQADTAPAVSKVEGGKTSGGGFGPAVEEEDDEPDPAPNNSYFPTSFGLTFCVAGDVERVGVNAEWGQYLREDSATEKRKSDDSPLTVWKRHPRTGSYELVLKDGPLERRALDVEFPNVVITGRVIRRQDEWIVTLLLTNDQGPAESKVETVTRWLFQPVLTVSGTQDQPIFVKRRRALRYENLDPIERNEVEELEMLYRKRVEFAVGHGVAVDWNRHPDSWERTDKIWTTCVPVSEVPKAKHATEEDEPELANLVLDMKELAEASSSDLDAKLLPMVGAYRSWIERQRGRVSDAAEGLEEFRAASDRTFRRCVQAADRIEEGIRLLGTDKDAAAAFQFANRAMWLQRIHTMQSEAIRRGETVTLADFDLPKNRSWRAFQLAFVLLNLPALAVVDHEDRKEADPNAGTEPMADLLWFPTGGGKTEAYLGLTAFTLAIRRLQGDLGGLRADSGVAVLMRYTLRLLTLQQFQRATALICACESIRREDSLTWGSYPFRIGLWVGQRTTPNRTEDARDAVDQDRDRSYSGGIGGSGTVRQLTNCPWCGHKIDVRNDIEVVTGVAANRTYTYCGDATGTCLFSRAKSPRNGLDGGLPIVVVDEEIYRLLPSLVIATVDKFAQMPWNGETQMLFGRVERFCPRHGFLSPESDHDANFHPARNSMAKADVQAHANLRPPDLIIQDELHLISGPLGSLVGIYEAAVDELCTWEVDGTRIRPKVIVSTATVRRASEQVNKLFDRKLSVFPPAGLDAEDNFFSKQPPATLDNPGTKYVGICSPGRRLKASLIRAYCATMASAQKLYDPTRYGVAVDPWMTTVGYFGSIRELAGMRRLIDDDIHQRLFRMDRVGLGKRSIRSYEELTSRKSAGDIPNILDRLEKQFTEVIEGPRPYDILLATNMISVGVDVKRLGLMIVGGQPKVTAEYIQATNRIGRSHPGLVFTVANWARPRDLSHYECFTYYHSTFHKHIETPSLTPFSDGTRERALSAILIAYSRLQGNQLNSNSSAATVDAHRTITDVALEAIVKRAENVQDAQLGQTVRAEIRSRIDEWNREVRLRKDAGASLAYRQSGTEVALLKKPEQGRWQVFTCLNSLREVEQSSAFVIHEMSQGVGEETE